MKVRTLIVASVAAAIAVLLTPRLISQEVPTVRTEVRPEARPGPEHWLLAELAGDWVAEARLFRGPEEAYGQDAGSAVVETLAGGRFVMCRTRLGAEPFHTEHVLILGFDRRAGRYTAVTFDSFQTSYQRAAGVYDPGEERILLRGEDTDPRTGATARFSIAVEIESADRFRVEFLGEAPDGSTVSMLETTYRRRE